MVDCDGWMCEGGCMRGIREGWMCEGGCVRGGCVIKADHSIV